MRVEVLEPETATYTPARRRLRITGTFIWRLLVLLLLLANLVVQVKSYQRTWDLEASSWSETEMLLESSKSEYLNLLDRVLAVEDSVTMMQVQAEIESQRREFK